MQPEEKAYLNSHFPSKMFLTVFFFVARIASLRADTVEQRLNKVILVASEESSEKLNELKEVISAHIGDLGAEVALVTETFYSKNIILPNDGIDIL